MNNHFDYKQKALKYKTKYMELKRKIYKKKMNLIGGDIPEWYTKFESELYEIYNQVYNKYPNVILTGSGVIAFLLKHLELNEELENFRPNDLDFYYRSKVWEPNPSVINTEVGNFNIKPDQINESSVTFKLSDFNLPNFIKSFDVSKIPNALSFNFKGIDIINLNRLKSDYMPDFITDDERKEKDLYKIKLINIIIEKIGKEGRLHEFGLDNNVSVRDKNPKRKSSLFDDFSDDESENESGDKNLSFEKKPKSIFD